MARHQEDPIKIAARRRRFFRAAWAVGAIAVLGAIAIVFLSNRPAQPVPTPWPTRALSLQRSLAAAASAPGTTSSESIVARPTTHGPSDIEVCGVGWVTPLADGSLDDGMVDRLQNDPAVRTRILAKLRADGGELGAATAWLLAIPEQGDAARDALARAATTTRDPAVYGIAFRACLAANTHEGNCGMLSAARWAQLDPGNATPWTYALGAANVLHDTAAQAEVLNKIATARTNRSWLYAAAGAVVDAAPDDDASQGAAYSLVVTAVSGQTAALPPFQNLLSACKGDALRDANRAQTCDAVATVLTEHPDNLIERLIGTAIGRNIGWSPDRVDLARAEQHAFMTAPDQAGLAGLDCGNIRAQMGRTRRLAATGEIGAMREWLARSGKTPGALLQEDRARRAQAAASSASQR